MVHQLTIFTIMLQLLTIFKIMVSTSYYIYHDGTTANNIYHYGTEQLTIYTVIVHTILHNIYHYLDTASYNIYNVWYNFLQYLPSMVHQLTMFSIMEQGILQNLPSWYNILQYLQLWYNILQYLP